MIDLIEDVNLKTIITKSNKDYNFITQSLKITLYLLKYRPAKNNILDESEIADINKYKNKKEFNNLFKLVLSQRSIKDLFLQFHDL